MSAQDLYGPGQTYHINNRPYLQFLARECQAAYTEPSDFEAGGVEVRVIEDDHGNLVFSFRGTTFDGADIIKDMRAIPRYQKDLGGWYHPGFINGARAILPHIIDELERHDRPNTRGVPTNQAPYLLVGHSKGGAEATDVAALMARLGRPPRALVTCGAPLAGDKSLRRILRDVPGHRLVNHHDPVTEVPWLLNKLGVFTHHRGATALYTALNSVWPDPRNHKISRYIDALGYNE